MRVRALKTIYGDGVTTKRDEEVDVSQYRGRQLVARGYAVESGPPIVPQLAEASDDTNPFEEHQSGGQTGEEKPASLSHRGRPRKKSKSTAREDDAAA